MSKGVQIIRHKISNSLMLIFLIKFQSFPVAASSLCLLSLSIDRYVTVKHPRLAQFRGRQFLPSILASLSWIGGGVICIPLLLAYKIYTSKASAVAATTIASTSPLSGHQLNPSINFPFRDSKLISDKRLCVSDYGSNEWHIVFIALYVSFVFIIPMMGVIFNHIGNDHNYCHIN